MVILMRRVGKSGIGERGMGLMWRFFVIWKAFCSDGGMDLRVCREGLGRRRLEWVGFRRIVWN
jgi:hypothetical protein